MNNNSGFVQINHSWFILKWHLLFSFR